MFSENTPPLETKAGLSGEKQIMNYEILTQITTLTSDVNTHFERAWRASMTQDNGKPDEVEMQHQINLAKTDLQKLNALVWPDSDFVISDVLAAQRAEIEGLQSDVFNLEGMD